MRTSNVIIICKIKTNMVSIDGIKSITFFEFVVTLKNASVRKNSTEPQCMYK